LALDARAVGTPRVAKLRSSNPSKNKVCPVGCTCGGKRFWTLAAISSRASQAGWAEVSQKALFKRDRCVFRTNASAQIRPSAPRKKKKNPSQPASGQCLYQACPHGLSGSGPWSPRAISGAKFSHIRIPRANPTPDPASGPQRVYQWLRGPSRSGTLATSPTITLYGLEWVLRAKQFVPVGLQGGGNLTLPRNLLIHFQLGPRPLLWFRFFPPVAQQVILSPNGFSRVAPPPEGRFCALDWLVSVTKGNTIPTSRLRCGVPPVTTTDSSLTIFSTGRYRLRRSPRAFPTGKVFRIKTPWRPGSGKSSPTSTWASGFTCSPKTKKNGRAPPEFKASFQRNITTVSRSVSRICIRSHAGSMSPQLPRDHRAAKCVKSQTAGRSGRVQRRPDAFHNVFPQNISSGRFTQVAFPPYD